MQQAEFHKNNKIELKLVGVANSTKYLLDKDGLSFEKARSIRNLGKPYHSFSEFVDLICSHNLRNSIVIDNTASEEVSLQYAKLFNHSISVVTCNKFAGSSPIANYKKLIKLTHDKNCKFQYETSVAAALPVIKTIQDLNNSGDRVNRIEAVLSGSLNFIFNNYNAVRPFADVVQQAKDEGYTEPDPKIDLTGLDVMRKILILSRESGYMCESDDVSFEGFLPENSLKAETPEEFIRILREEEAHFKALFQQAQQNNCRLKVVAVMDAGKLSVSLRQVDAASPFYHLDGKDNIVSLFTKRYNPEPLIIKGAGAGAEVTASGVFSDLIYIVNR
jgi:aspartokinase/homoserine dehydrogenase 1